MYIFPAYWTDKLKIDFLQRVVLIHSYLYYEEDSPKWSDKKFDEIAKQLVELQKEYSQKTIRVNTQYGYVFYDFDGTTGFDLFSRLNGMDKQFIGKLAKQIIKGE